MFRCRHCEFLQTQIDRARADARADLALARTDHEAEIRRLMELLDDANRKNDRLQLAVFQGIGSGAANAYVDRTDVANAPAAGNELPPGPSDDDEISPEQFDRLTPFEKIKRAQMRLDRVQGEHKAREKANITAISNPPGSFVKDPRPENDLVAR